MIRDVIYQLRQEYGKKATFTVVTGSSTNLTTGIETQTTDTVIVRKAIRLEIHFKQAILKVLGINEKTGYQLVGDFQLLVDRKELRGKVISVNDLVSTDSIDGKIVKIDDFDSAYILSVNKI